MMKLHLLHGPGVISSRSKLQSIKKQFDAGNTVVFGPESSIQQIMGSLLTHPLFFGDRLIILENPQEDFINFLLIPPPLTLVLWFDHEIDIKSPLLKFVKKNRGEISFFDIGKEASVFPFLDYLANKDNKAFPEMQKLETAGFDVFYILNMVFYLLRSLCLTPKNAPDFVKRKLIKQRSNFLPEDIRKLYEEILEIEFGLKFGLIDQSQAKFSLVLKFLCH